MIAPAHNVERVEMSDSNLTTLRKRVDKDKVRLDWTSMSLEISLDNVIKGWRHNAHDQEILNAELVKCEIDRDIAYIRYQVDSANYITELMSSLNKRR